MTFGCPLIAVYFVLLFLRPGSLLMSGRFMNIVPGSVSARIEFLPVETVGNLVSGNVRVPSL